MFQLRWESEAVEYTNYLWAKVSVHGNASASAKEVLKTINKSVPFTGSRFVPPSFIHYARRDTMPAIKPEHIYLAELTIIHPVFYPHDLVNCPHCGSQEIQWDSWNATGARDVHGLLKNERVLGYQLRCKICKDKNDPVSKGGPGYCFATTNPAFWSKWDHWSIPSTFIALLKHSTNSLIIHYRRYTVFFQEMRCNA